MCISLLETCTFCHTLEANGFFHNMLILYSLWVLLKSHTELVHQHAILERHCQSYMWMGQQGTGDVHYCAYLLCLHTCSFVPLDLTSSRIKFLKISRWRELWFNQAWAPIEYGAWGPVWLHTHEAEPDLEVRLLSWWWRLILASLPALGYGVCNSLKG